MAWQTLALFRAIPLSARNESRRSSLRMRGGAKIFIMKDLFKSALVDEFQRAENQLLQVLLNLFQNAIQAIPESGVGGKVTVRARPAGDPPTSRVVIEISDNGVGIEP